MVGPDTDASTPAVDRDDWTLTVDGAVAEPLSFSVDELTALPSTTYTADFTCVEGWVAEDCTWRGVSVADLYALAEPTAESTHALVRALDGDYACSFPKARLADAVLATGLDGDPLPVEHGGPARLVPTGEESDCWQSVKWVDTISLHTAEPDREDTARERALSRVSE